MRDAGWAVDSPRVTHAHQAVCYALHSMQANAYRCLPLPLAPPPRPGFTCCAWSLIAPLHHWWVAPAPMSLCCTVPHVAWLNPSQRERGGAARRALSGCGRAAGWPRRAPAVKAVMSVTGSRMERTMPLSPSVRMWWM